MFFLGYRCLRKWLPCARVVKLIATKDERQEILKKELRHDKFDICLTSYQGINICITNLQKFKWKYIVIDEAHKIKNEESLLSIVTINRHYCQTTKSL